MIEQGAGVDLVGGYAQGVLKDLADADVDLGFVGRGAAVGAVGGAGEVADVAITGEAGDGAVEVFGQRGGWRVVPVTR